MAIYSDLHITIILIKVTKTAVGSDGIATKLGYVLSKLIKISINDGKTPIVFKQANTDRYLSTWAFFHRSEIAVPSSSVLYHVDSTVPKKLQC